ncbi:MAG: hypothetical protein ACP5RS_02235 [Thermoplasmata archaeon]
MSDDAVNIPYVEIRDGFLWNSSKKDIIRDENNEPEDPFYIVDKLSKISGIVYIIDINGIEDNSPQLDLLQELTEYSKLWVDTSPRRIEDVYDVLIVGAMKSIINTFYIKKEGIIKIFEDTVNIGVRLRGDDIDYKDIPALKDIGIDTFVIEDYDKLNKELYFLTEKMDIDMMSKCRGIIYRGA